MYDRRKQSAENVKSTEAQWTKTEVSPEKTRELVIKLTEGMNRIRQAQKETPCA
jgi:hypothetical protein